jgi:hypothetical protein
MIAANTTKNGNPVVNCDNTVSNFDDDTVLDTVFADEDSLFVSSLLLSEDDTDTIDKDVPKDDDDDDDDRPNLILL